MRLAAAHCVRRTKINADQARFAICRLHETDRCAVVDGDHSINDSQSKCTTPRACQRVRIICTHSDSGNPGNNVSPHVRRPIRSTPTP
jgi:hypothetical protein